MDIKALMRQAQQVQEKMKKVEEELANKEYEGASGGGLVKVIINGSGIAKKISIDQSFFHIA